MKSKMRKGRNNLSFFLSVLRTEDGFIKILAIDQARNGAWAIFNYETKELEKYGTFSFGSKKYTYAKAILAIETLVDELIKENDIGDILVSSRGIKRVNTALFDCDLYDLLDGDERAAEKFLGEYMLDYSWAEARMALLAKYI